MELTQLKDYLIKKMKNNEKAVKTAISSLLGMQSKGSMSSPAEEQILTQQRCQEQREVKEMMEKGQRVELKIKQVMRKAMTLNNKVLTLIDLKDLENLLESKEWEKKDEIVSMMEKALEDTIGTEVETKPMKDLVYDLTTHLK